MKGWRGHEIDMVEAYVHDKTNQPSVVDYLFARYILRLNITIQLHSIRSVVQENGFKPESSTSS